MHLRLKLRCAGFLACRTAEMSWEELWGDEKGWSVLITPQCKQLRRIYLDDMWEEMGWDEKSWDEARWGAKSQDEMRWDEVWSVKCEVRSAGCEERSVKCEESLRLELHCAGVVHRSCSWTTTVQQLRTKHARTGLAGARLMQVL